MNRGIKKTVHKILLQDEYARQDDWYLIQQVVMELLPCDSGTGFGQVLQGMKIKGISFEGITRARRKFFEQYPQLKVEDVEKARRKEEEKYINEYGRKKYEI